MILWLRSFIEIKTKSIHNIEIIDRTEIICKHFYRFGCGGKILTCDQSRLARVGSHFDFVFFRINSQEMLKENSSFEMRKKNAFLTSTNDKRSLCKWCVWMQILNVNNTVSLKCSIFILIFVHVCSHKLYLTTKIITN